jgi:hypothetical protein
MKWEQVSFIREKQKHTRDTESHKAQEWAAAPAVFRV